MEHIPDSLLRRYPALARRIQSEEARMALIEAYRFFRCYRPQWADCPVEVFIEIIDEILTNKDYHHNPVVLCKHLWVENEICEYLAWYTQPSAQRLRELVLDQPVESGGQLGRPSRCFWRW